ncbi:MAG TPA: AAA family ATPase [Candidatus Cybelea sp.]|nr:AAA family ATPase [Candidatus Cybelea sp.]
MGGSVSIDDVTDWLASLGLEKYAQAFAANDINADVIADLSDADLESLGMSLGHRRKFLKAVAALQDERPAGERRDERQPGGERRQLTVMFCDLVGSTALAADLDPEDLREVIGRFQDVCAGAVARFDGYIAKFMGDGVLAYFGYPQAHEDDAERAVRSALRIVDAVARLEAPVREALHCRVGIATGLVVVGETIGEGLAREQAVVGETPNLAARLQTAAEPDAIVVSAATRRLIGRNFRCADLGRLTLKGIGEPVQAWRVLGLQDVESRFEASHAGQLAELVGRERELGQLIDQWGEAKRGRGRVCLLQGEAGIGKSRLTEALHAHIAEQPHFRVRYQCSPFHVNSPLHPAIVQLQYAAGWSAEDSADRKLDLLETLLRQSNLDLRRAVPVLASLLSIETGGRYAPLQLAPREQKEQTIVVMIEMLRGLSRQRPVLFVLEDAHWIDPTSLELFTRLVDVMSDWPLLLVVTARPEFHAPWDGHECATTIVLGRLGSQQVAAMAYSVAGGAALPEDILQQIIAKTDGVPIFVEELTKNVLEIGLLQKVEGRFVMTGPLPALAIPTTLKDSLMARLDRLGKVKDVAQIAAGIGREFSFRLLSAVLKSGDAELAGSLNRLTASGLIFARGAPPEATYVFKHTLLQEAAYDSMLRSRRQQLHARIAESLETHFPELVEAQPELCAHHFARAGYVDKAFDYALVAAQRAAARFANAESIKHYAAARELLGTMPEGRERDRRELDLQIGLGVPMLAAKGYAAQEVEDVYARARELCTRIPGTPHTFAASRGLWNSRLMRYPLPQVERLSAELVAYSETLDDPDRQSLACRAHGTSLLCLGRLDEALTYLDRAVRLRDAAGPHSQTLLYGEDAGAISLAYSGWVTWLLGRPEEAVRRSAAAVARARTLDHAFMEAFTLNLEAVVHQFRRDTGATLATAEACYRISKANGFIQWQVHAELCIGCAMALNGQFEEGVLRFERGWSGWQGIGAKLMTHMLLLFGAEARFAAGDKRGAMEALTASERHSEEQSERHAAALVQCLRARILMSGAGSEAEAERSWRRGLDIARSQGARLPELRAATGLAELMARTGRRSEAKAVLNQAYSGFDQGFAEPDLVAAKALLDALG